MINLSIAKVCFNCTSPSHSPGESLPTNFENLAQILEESCCFSTASLENTPCVVCPVTWQLAWKLFNRLLTKHKANISECKPCTHVEKKANAETRKIKRESDRMETHRFVHTDKATSSSRTLLGIAFDKSVGSNQDERDGPKTHDDPNGPKGSKIIHHNSGLSRGSLLLFTRFGTQTKQNSLSTHTQTRT